MKVCTKCNIEKDIKDFWLDSQKSDGLKSSCKICNYSYKLKHIKQICKFSECSNIEYGKQGICKIHYQQLWRTKYPEKVALDREKIKHYRQINKEKISIKNKEWALRNKEKRKINKRNWQLKQYGLTPNTFNELLKSQNNKCSICKLVFSDTIKLHIDHNHKTDKIRGLLCSQCNTGIGQLRESEEIFLSAIDYLRRSN